MADPNRYLERETLKDGTPVTVRAIRPEDAPSILEAFGKLDSESIYRRFFGPKKELSAAELERLTAVDFDRVVALMVTAETPDGEILIAASNRAIGRNPRSSHF